MSHVFSLPDEAYERIEAYAARHGQTVEELIVVWAQALDRESPTQVTPGTAVYDPADDPLADFLGKGELTSPDAIQRHDEAIAAEAIDAHEG